MGEKKSMNLNNISNHFNVILQKDAIAIVWLGQAGFLIRDSMGNSLAIDIYLSDSCERIAGFKRLMPAIIKPEQMKIDILLATHNHPDHLDTDTVPTVMSNPKTILVGPISVIEACEKMGLEKSRMTCLKIGEEIKINNTGIKAVYADHGELAPDAVGFLITIDGVKIYFTGDTGFCPEKLTDAIQFKPDIIIPPINGAYGNLNSEEAAKLTGETGANISIPCHFWTFKEHGGNPQAFFEAMKVYAPNCEVKFLTPGEVYIYQVGRF